MIWKAAWVHVGSRHGNSCSDNQTVVQPLLLLIGTRFSRFEAAAPIQESALLHLDCRRVVFSRSNCDLDTTIASSLRSRSVWLMLASFILQLLDFLCSCLWLSRMSAESSSWAAKASGLGACLPCGFSSGSRLSRLWDDNKSIFTKHWEDQPTHLSVFRRGWTLQDNSAYWKVCKAVLASER